MGSTQNFIPTATTKIYKWKTSQDEWVGEAIGLYQEPTVHRCNLAIAAGFFLFFLNLFHMYPVRLRISFRFP